MLEPLFRIQSTVALLLGLALMATTAFAFADAAALASGMPGGPSLTIRAGRHSD